MRLKHIALIILVLAVIPGTFVYREYSSGTACNRCHEIGPSYTEWLGSSHRNVRCTQCHGGAVAFDNVRRAVRHVRRSDADQIRLTHETVIPIAERCRSCHEQEFAQWQAGPHSASYTKIFLDAKHNSERRLMDDCLRCHGMYFAGGIRELVAPLDAKGPWKLLKTELAQQPAIPCLGCHQIHRPGQPLGRGSIKAAESPKQELLRPSVALYDRREQRSFSARVLAIPQMREQNRLVKMSSDQRQALCYACHAPLVTAQVWSGDDRTSVGVHEGISCLACHQKHSQQTRQSCATCHPRMSNCGRDVETMDTTFKDPKSRHNIHTVKCIDCHPKGVPQKPGVRRVGQPAFSD